MSEHCTCATSDYCIVHDEILALRTVNEQLRTQLVTMRDEFAVMARACGNWRAFPGSAKTDHDHPDWKAAARAICERDELRSRLTEAVECCTIKDNRNLWLEIRLQKIMARCADLLDEDQFNELDAIVRAADSASEDIVREQRLAEAEALLRGIRHNFYMAQQWADRIDAFLAANSASGVEK